MLVGVAVAAVAGVFSVLVSWYYQPHLAGGYLRAPTATTETLRDSRRVRARAL